MAEKKTWHIRETASGESVHSIEVDADMSDRQEERLLRGMLTNMNRDRFHVDTGNDRQEADS